jgi:hypothetical protein
MGAQQCFVNVKVTNNGPAPYPANSTDVVRLYWAKASAGLSWPAPWNDPASVHGGTVAPAQPIGAIPVGGSQTLVFTWPVTPNPAHFKGDGHFCLLAMIAKATTPEFDGLQGPDLNENV